jgi:hypothetical protein
LAVISEFLRIQQCRYQVGQESDGEHDDNDSCNIHGLPQPLAGPDVGQRQGEKQYGEDDHQQIEHRAAPSLAAAQAQSV